MFEVASDVYGIDVEMFDTEVLAAYVIDAEEPVLVETGYPNSIDRIRAELRDADIDPATVAHAVASHVHIDHSGGAASLTRDNPDLSVYIHEATADHLVDPAALTESSRDAMGEHFSEMGEPDPVPAENLVRVSDEGAAIDAGDRTVDLVHTPGHSPDHLAAWDPTSGTLFANEALGSYYPRADRWLPPATLPRFDPAAVRESADRLSEFDADRLAMSHFGVRADPAEAIDTARERLATFERRVEELYETHGNVADTERAVWRELVALDDYADGIVAFETRFQTRGFLKSLGLL
ncbi:MBL fold metallo-hydrolase [Halobacteriales archaeon Cl-PHB]